jgi:hypothetical protein
VALRNCISIEDGIGAQVLAALGHHVIPASSFGGGQSIVIDEDSGVLLGGSDPRKDVVRSDGEGPPGD